MSQAVVVSGGTDIDTPQYLEELVPAGEKTALLFHISYLCLGKFPTLERLIRRNAVDVQMAFGASDALLLQCISTSNNMVSSLFPMLIKCVERNNAMLAVRFLEKARHWIQTIISDAQGMVNEYAKLTQGVASATSDVNSTKVETDQLITQLNTEQEELKKNVAFYKQQMEEKENNVKQNENEINAANESLRAIINEIAQRNKKFGIVAAVIPFLGQMINEGQKSINNPSDQGRLEVARDAVADLRNKRAILSRELGASQTELMHWQFKLTEKSISLGAVPDPVHLPEVQQCLTRIQEILIQLKNFWEKIGVLVKDLQQKTFAGEDFVEFLEDFKDDFLETINVASQAWVKFGTACAKVSDLFTLKNKDAYKFLQTSPNSMTQQEWDDKYAELKARLDQFYQPAIEEVPEGAEAETV